MKVKLELDIEPEEVRRLVGLPDAQAFWESIQKRIEKGDSEIAVEMIKSVVGESVKMTELAGKFVGGLKFLQSNSKESKPAAKKTTVRKRAKKKL